MADLSIVQTSGGHKSTAVAAGAGTADVVVSAKPGRVTKLVVTTAGTAVLQLHDHPTDSSAARLIWSSLATPAVGDVITLDIPVANGVVAKQANGSAAVTVYFTEDDVPATGLSADKCLPVTNGGQYTSFHAAGAPGAGIALAAKGRMCKLVVLTVGSAATLIYDNASAASGKLLYSLKATPTLGDVIDLQLPAANGIYVSGATNTSSVLVTYNTDSPNGR